MPPADRGSASSTPSDRQTLEILSLVLVDGRTVEITCRVRHEVPPRPDFIRDDHWWDQSGDDEVVVSVPIARRSATIPPPQAYGLVGQDADGKDIYIRYTAQSGSWTAGPRVNPATGKAM